MKHIPFTKMHGLGNSYIYIDAKQCPLPDSLLPHLAQSIANPNTGIGSDGLIIMQPSEIATVRMRIFNKDGSEGKNCGNGVRCIAKYVYDNGWTSIPTLTVQTASRVVEARIEEHSGRNARVSVNMGEPLLARSAIPMLGPKAKQVVAEPFDILGRRLLLTAVSMGNPHAVFFESDPTMHLKLGSAIELDDRFPEGTNVEFVEMVDPDHMICRVWERGSGPTQACGTGACASVVAAVLNGFCSQDQGVTVHLPGGDLIIKWATNGVVWMTGDATDVATGIYTHHLEKGK